MDWISVVLYDLGIFLAGVESPPRDETNRPI